MTPKDYSQMIGYLTRPAMADGGRIGFKDGPGGSRERTDLQFENLTRKENAKRLKLPTTNAPAFNALPDYPNITYTDYKDKKTGRKFRTYGVRVRRQDKKVSTAATTRSGFSNIPTLEEAIKVRDEFAKANPKNIKPLDPEKAKITKDTRRGLIESGGGDEAFLRGKKGTGVQKGHAGNIKNPDLKITPSSIIYTPEEINVGMAGQEGTKGAKETFTDLDYKIEVAEDKIKQIKKSNISPKEKRRLLDVQDKLLTDYHFQSGGFKTPTLSDGTIFGESTRKTMSMDPIDLFPNMTEKETKKFVRQYITEKGTLKPFYQRLVDSGEISEIDKENIRKSKLFLDNVELAKQNVKNFDVPAMKRSAAKGVENLLLKLSGQIDKDCAQAVADGGRIGLQSIGSRNVCITKAKNYMSEQLERGIGTQQNAKTSLIKRILAGSANFIKQNLSPKELLKMENLIGKPALYGAAAFETGLVADDVFRKGKPLNVAAAESLFGSVLNLDADAARAKNLLESNVQLSPAAQEYAQNILDYDKYRKLNLSFPSSLVASKMPGSDEYFKMQEELKNKIENTPETGVLDYQSALDESEGTFKAKPKELFGFEIDSPDAPDVTPLTNKLARSPGTRVGPMTAKKDMQIDLSLPTYDRSFTASDDFLNQYLKNIGQEPLRPGEGTLFRMLEPNQKGLFGASEKFAGGGIAKLAGVSSGPPPESGPNSQGLQGLMKRVRNY